MKRTGKILLIAAVCGLLLCGCGQEPAPAEEPAIDYNDLVTPPVDLTITDCISEQQLTTVVGYSMQLLGVYDEGTQALYQSPDGNWMVTINLKNQTRAEFDASIANVGDSVTLYEGLGEIAYRSAVTGEMLVYSDGYSLGVVVTSTHTTDTEIYNRQIAELILTALQPQ